MRKILMISSAAVLLATSAYAQEVSEPLLIAGASESGGYFAKATQAAEKLNQSGHDTKAVTTNGSDEITKGVCSGEFLAGYTQIDAMFQRAREGCSLAPIAKYGEGETAFLLVPSKSEIGGLDEMTGENRILVNTIGSGASLFWDTIVSIETGEDGNKSDWSKAQPVNEVYGLADTLAEFGDIDAVLMVATPRYPALANLVGLGWEVVDLYDKDIDDQQFNNTSLYEKQKMNFRLNGSKVKASSYLVRSFAVVTEGTKRNDPTFYRDLAGAMR